MTTLLFWLGMAIAFLATVKHVDQNNKEDKAKIAKKENRIIYL
jgi:hypothetical protein